MILDASVIVAWFVTDVMLTARALEVRSDVLAAPDSVVVPAICWTEVAHALVRAVRRDRLPAEAVEPAGAALRELMGIIPTREVDPVEAMRLAVEQGIGVYDASYLVLARSLRRPLLTLDRRVAAAGAPGAIDVVWLGDDR
jgi:predicted nucleic acid-binding protein